MKCKYKYKVNYVIFKNMFIFKYKFNVYGVYGISNVNFVYYSIIFMIVSNIYFNRFIY